MPLKFITPMQHIITDEEVKRAMEVYVDSEGPTSLADMKEALLDFLNNRPESTLGKLRPIAEMPETVPEGCLRYFFALHGDGALCHVDTKQINITQFAIDILSPLPTPDLEAEERQRFEEVTEEAGLCSDFRRNENGLYRITETCVAWDAWKLRSKQAK